MTADRRRDSSPRIASQGVRVTQRGLKGDRALAQQPAAEGVEAIVGAAAELAAGVVTPGWWDLRPTAARLPWPGSLAGLRCLDVGTMDGFWAFELERRGAGEVHAIDLVDPAKQDAPYDQRLKRDLTPLAQLRGQTFRAAAELLGSHVQYHDLNVYDLDPGGIGQFDLVLMG